MWRLRKKKFLSFPTHTLSIFMCKIGWVHDGLRCYVSHRQLEICLTHFMPFRQKRMPPRRDTNTSMLPRIGAELQKKNATHRQLHDMKLSAFSTAMALLEITLQLTAPMSSTWTSSLWTSTEQEAPLHLFDGPKRLTPFYEWLTVRPNRVLPRGHF